MARPIRQLSGLAWIVLATLPWLCPVAAHAAEPQVTQLAFMAGCWRATDGDPGTVEQWTAPAGDSMLGMSRTVKAGKTVMYEFMRIGRDTAGRIAFFAQPRGVAVTEFAAVSITATEVVFENTGHDFPQRVGYRATPADGLHAWIEGTIDGKRQRADYHFERGNCGHP